jgi:RimJ/RimL family protein N-acetyltransferase
VGYGVRVTAIEPRIDSPILPARATDSADFASHLVRHLKESATGGLPHFTPVLDVSRAEVIHESERRWSTPTDRPGWGRAWLLWSSDPRARSGAAPPLVCGHVELRGPLVPTALHRAELSMGLERGWIARGYGTRLLRTAISAAREMGSLEYLDLRVFGENAPARALYRRAGFIEVGVVRDVFRMPDGARIDDYLMVLKLSPVSQ